jgi:hypothetical protein
MMVERIFSCTIKNTTKKQKTWTQGLTSNHQHKKKMMQFTMCIKQN